MAAAVLIAVFCALVVSQSILYKRMWNKNLRFKMSFSRGAGFEGEKVTVSESLSNNKRLPLPWVVASYKLPTELVFLDSMGYKVTRWDEWSTLFVPGIKKRQTKRTEVLLSKRGYYRVNGAELASSNMLMTGNLRQNVEITLGITVYPRLIEVSEYEIPYRKITGEILARRYINPDPFEFRGIREYQPYDNFRQINFKATARTGELMSNVYDYTASQEIELLLNLEQYSLHDRTFVHEQAIRLAAFLCREYIMAGIPVAFKCPSPSVVTNLPARVESGVSKAHLERIYTALAHIDVQAPVNRNEDFMPGGLVGGHGNKAYIIISSYHGGDLYGQYMSLKSKGAYIKWIIPRCERDELSIEPNDDIMPYEVMENGR